MPYKKNASKDNCPIRDLVWQQVLKEIPLCGVLVSSADAVGEAQSATETPAKAAGRPSLLL